MPEIPLRQTLEEKLSMVDLPQKTKEKILAESDEVKQAMLHSRNAVDFLGRLIHLKPSAQKADYDHIVDYLNAINRLRIEAHNRINAEAREKAHHLLKVGESLESLGDRPTALMAFRVSALPGKMVEEDPLTSTTALHQSTERRDWVEEQIELGFNIIFALDGGLWRLVHNGTKLSEQEVMNSNPQSELSRKWKASHPVESVRQRAEEDEKGETKH